MGFFHIDVQQGIDLFLGKQSNIDPWGISYLSDLASVPK